MPELPEDLSTLKDDMVAFIEGHGMRRFPGYIDHEEVQTIMWKSGEDSAEGWKDFVELAKSAGSPFLIMDSWLLQKEELDAMIQRGAEQRVGRQGGIAHQAQPGAGRVRRGAPICAPALL